MTQWRPWPRRLAGQMALLLTIALFVAQAINFGLLLDERRRTRFEQATQPAVTRIVDAIERGSAGLPPIVGRGRIRIVAASPIAPNAEHRADVEQGLRSALAEAGLKVGRIETAVRDIRPGDPRLRLMPAGRRARMVRSGGEIVIAVEQPGTGWLVLRAPWPRTDRAVIARLVAQTLILFGILLLIVLWAAARVSRPLATLAEAARRFRPGESATPLAETGPSDVRAVIAAFNALRLRVTAMLEEKDRMLGAIGHDLRTPLASLRVRIESVDDDTDRAKMADTIAEMERTLDDILSLARLGRPSEPPVETDLSALVDAVVEDFRDLGAIIGLAETPRLTIRLRPSSMRRALRNLLENAIKYGERAEVAIVAGTGTAGAAEVAILIADAGPGIPPDRLDDVFDAFTRIETSRSRATGGAGLGLALARAIVRDAGGDVTLANRPEGGLLATITLPR